MEAELKSPPIKASRTASRAVAKDRRKFSATMGIFVFCFLLYSMLVCGCCFHAVAMIPALAPLAWALFLLSSYGTTEGRIGAWAAFGGAMLFLWMGIDSNLKFAPSWQEFGRFVILHSERS